MQSFENLVFPFTAQTKSGEGLIYSPAIFEDSDTFILVKRGICTVHSGTYHAEGKSGSVFYVPHGIVHWAETDGSSAEILYLIFSHKLVAEKMEAVDSDLFYMFNVQSKTRITHYTEEDDVYPLLLENLVLATDEYDARDVCCYLNVCACIYRMVAGVLRHYFYTKGERDTNVYHNVMRLRPVLSYIENRYQEKIYVDAMAELMNVSPDHFTKLFRDSIGTTPIDFINALRVNKAMLLLATEDSNVAEISEKLGFSGPNHFHKIFKAYLDMSPLSFRKLAK